MTDYSSLAELRGALTSEDPQQRADAYGAVLETDGDVPAVLETPVGDDTVQTLVDGGVIPESKSAGMTTREYRTKVLDLLEQIAVNTGGDTA